MASCSRSTRRALVWRGFAAVVFLALAASGHVAESRVTFANSLAPLPVTTGAKTAASSRLVASRVTAASAAQLAAPMDFSVALQMRNPDEFQARVASGERVSYEEVQAKYMPLQSDYDRVAAWLKTQGFTLTMNDATRLSVFARGTAAQVQGSFQVTMQSVTVDGVAYTAAATSPSLPASVTSGVLGVNGLQPYIRVHPHHVDVPTGGVQTFTNNSPPFLIGEVRNAYDSTTLTTTSNGTTTTLDGSNQKIAIIIDAFALHTDLTAFWSNNGVAQNINNIEEVNVPGGSTTNREEEETLDEEWASGIAPGAKVRVYCSNSLNSYYVDQCYARIASDVTGSSASAIAQPQLHVLSLSYGGLESSYPQSLYNTEKAYFTTIANGNTFYGGVSIFTSSGDNGSEPNGSSLSVEYPAADLSITGVGGTNLYYSAGGTPRPWTETGWYGSGGGASSSKIARPSWQTGAGVPTGTTRLVPDVSLVASNYTYASFYYTDASGNVTTGIAGTSWSAPTWAGFAALMNQARVIQGRLPLGFLNTRLYDFIGTNNFYDVTSGNNSPGGTGNSGGTGVYSAGVGYDEVTGIGTPDLTNLLNTLLGPAITGFTPTVGGTGSTVVITGTNFYTSASLPLAVEFNNTAATSFTVDSPTQITATVPSGVTSGPITVISLGDATVSTASFVVGTPDLTVTKTHTGNFTYLDTGDTYTITVTNIGNAPTIGTVSVVDTLPNGALTATGLTGTGWTIASNNLSATRTDLLQPGSSYPPLTLTVSVPGSPQTTTNQVNVSGGGETNTANDSAQDSTTIAGQTPSQAWRYQSFGTNANTGNAADTANPSGDGLNNLTKYALGLDPTVPTLNPETEEIGTGYLRLTVPRNANATDITYSVQVTSDLTDPASWTTNDTLILQSSPTLLQVRDTTPVSGTAKRFIRLQVSR